MDVTNQFPEIDVFLADDGFIAVLKKLPVALIPSIEIDHIPCQKPPHQGREPSTPRSEKKMGMVGEKGPGVADGICSGQQIGETIHHVIAVFVVAEYLPAFNAANHHVVDYPGSI